jgi:iron complex transport system ATP-binding protein
MNMATLPYLETNSLAIGYRSKNSERFLFDSLNLNLLPGQLVCFMGPNGIGKSTLIRTLAGLQKPLSGEIKVNPRLGERLSKQISVVLTDKITGANLTVFEVVAFGRYPYLDWNVRLLEKDLEIIDQSIRRVNIDHLRNQRINSLSDGQMQMVMLARALAQDTPVILLDEPTAHLDLNNRVEIMKLLRRLARETQKAILISTHELDLALQMADRIWLAGLEKNIVTGIPEDLVLDGIFDSIFQFKGFDLKTGKVKHDAHMGRTVKLIGDGSEYLWTKNALERSGFEISGESSINILIEKETSLRWIVSNGERTTTLSSLEEVVNSI